MKVLWITDSWKSLHHSLDSTLRLMEESLYLGLETYWTDIAGVNLLNGRLIIIAKRLNEVKLPRSENGFEFDPEQQWYLSDFGTVHLRVDPPLNESYIAMVSILSIGSQIETKLLPNVPATQFLNSLNAILSVSSKLEFLSLGLPIPRFVVTARSDIANQFGRECKRCVMKPTLGCQCIGVELLEWGTQSDVFNSLKKFELSTDRFQKPVVLQEFLKDIELGETRYWFVDGKLVSHATKISCNHCWPIDIDRGAIVIPKSLSPSDNKLVSRIGFALRAKDIRLAAVDVIGDYVTDFNIVSPGLICQIEKALSINLAKKILESLYLT